MTTHATLAARLSAGGTERFLRFHIKTRHLALLVELGRHGSILQAAKAACLTQPGASKLLSELENAIGLPLFERLPRGILPTPFGKVMIRRAGAALAEMAAAHEEVMGLVSGQFGSVSVGCVLAPASQLVPQAVNLMKSRHPGIHVSIAVETSKVLVERLRSGELDMIVGRVLDPAAMPGLQFEPVDDEPHSLIVRAGHPWAARADLTLAQIAGARWILPCAPSMLRERLLSLFMHHGAAQPADTIETNSLPAILGLLAGSDCVVALPEVMVRPHLEAGALAVVPFELGLRADVYGIVTRRQHRLAPGAEAMLAALREVVAMQDAPRSTVPAALLAQARRHQSEGRA